MPKWGLTTAQAADRPWGLQPELLEPMKTVTDPVHKDVHLNRLEWMIVDSPAMQRLRRIRQLGTSHLVYPGAVHSRFSHALGALRAAQDLLDAVADTRNGPRPEDDLLAEWGGTFDAKMAEVTVLARLGALLHDLCHIPYGHTIEDELGILVAHDANEPRFDRLWATLPKPVLAAFDKADPRLVRHLRPLILSKLGEPKKGAVVPHWYEYPFVADIVGNTICADLMDYLARDHMFCGLPVALGTRFTNEFYVNRDEAHFAKRMVIRVTRDRHERPDVVTELLKYLRYRYELSERVLYHHAKLAADAMIGKMLELWHDHEWAAAATAGRRRNLLPLAAGDIADLRKRLRPTTAAAIDADVQQRMEEVFTAHGDDGLLECLAALNDPSDDDRLVGVRTLAQAVLDRELFKLGGRADDTADQGLAEQVHGQYGGRGGRDERRKLEKRAARFVGLDAGWNVVVWIPPTEMKLKVAGVLVNRNGKVNTLDKVGYDRATEIYNAHQRLWGVNVYAPAGVVDDDVRCRRLLAFVGAEIGVRFRDRYGDEVPGPGVIAASEVAEARRLTVRQTRELLKVVENQHIAAHNADQEFENFDALMQRVEALATAEGFNDRARRN